MRDYETFMEAIQRELAKDDRCGGDLIRPCGPLSPKRSKSFRAKGKATGKTLTPDEWRKREMERAQAEIDRDNAVLGKLDVDHVDFYGNEVRGDGIQCKECRNRGYSYVLLVDAGGVATRYIKPCKCLTWRAAARRLRESGLERAVARCTFESFADDEGWQSRMKDVAMDYVLEGFKEGAWLYIGGQSGCGKTHIATAVAGRLLKDWDLRYMMWPHDAQRIKAVANEAEAYEEMVEPLQTVKVLFIDDFLKPTRNRDGGEAMATSADMKLAFDILNYRYVNALPTIITSEWFSGELSQIDEAVAGRIAEMCGSYKLDVGRDAKRNYRLKGNVI